MHPKKNTGKKDKAKETRKKKAIRKKDEKKEVGMTAEEAESFTTNSSRVLPPLSTVQEIMVCKERLHEDVEPFSLSLITQKMFNCIPGENVSKESPIICVSKQSILNDIKERSTVSEFYPLKHLIEEYPGEKLLLVYDHERKDHQSFYLCIESEEKECVITEVSHVEELKEEEDGWPFSDQWPDINYKLPGSKIKPWNSLGSEKEIDEQWVKSSRDKITIHVTRNLKKPLRKIVLSDRNACKDYCEFPSVLDMKHRIFQKHTDRAVQTTKSMKSKICQTEIATLKQVGIQYEPRIFEKDEKFKVIGEMEKVNSFVKESSTVMLETIKDDLTSDIFKDDWLSLSKEEFQPPKFTDGHIKVFQSFTSLKYSVKKLITHVSWHPTIQGIIIISCIELCHFSECINVLTSLSRKPSLILFWSFIDPINPKLLLEAPDDVMIFKFNPANPNLLAAGCRNGQLILWDLSSHQEELQKMTEHQQVKQKKFTIYEEREKSLQVPVVKPIATSNVKFGHQSGIFYLEWFPNNVEFGENGHMKWKDSDFSTYLMTTGADSNIMIWDIEPGKKIREDYISEANKQFYSIYASLDLIWRPIHSLLPTMNGRKTTISVFTFDIKPVLMNQTVKSKGSTGSQDATIPSSNYLGGTIAGDIVYGDWKIPFDETGQLTESIPPIYTEHVVDGYVNTVQQSPFIKDIYLVIGGWKMAIYKTGRQCGVLLRSSSGTCRYTAGCWSLSRPGVIYIGLKNGTVEVWDLLIQTHESVQIQHISSYITKIVPNILKENTLAISDARGTLHILELPLSLSVPVENEQMLVERYFKRELNRLEEQQKTELIKKELLQKEKQKNKTVTEIKKIKEEQVTIIELDEETILNNNKKEYDKLEVMSLVALGILPSSALDQFIDVELEEEEESSKSIFA